MRALWTSAHFYTRLFPLISRTAGLGYAEAAVPGSAGAEDTVPGVRELH